MYITSADQLNDFCSRLHSSEVLAVDTEFVRERTYFHKVGLIQVAGKNECAAIDPILLDDLSPLLEILKDPNKTKVFHAARQDLEILVRLCGQVIPPVFDTQIAAALVGWGSQISFAKLIQKALGKHIHKTETYTDWCRRPLSQNQIQYAIDDVRYLMPAYESLLEKLKQLNRSNWMKGEVSNWEDSATFALPDPQTRYMKIKSLRSLKPRNMAVLRELAAWRERLAVTRDCLAKSIVRDETLLEIARKMPADIKDLSSIRGFYHKELGKSGKAIIESVKRGNKVPEDELPTLPESDGYSTTRGIEELLSAFVQIRSEELKIEPSVLADRKRIHSFATHFEQSMNMDDHFLLQGWRKECIGKPMLSLLNGEVGLKINPSGQVTLIPIK
ncbi:MAG: ribonuclease D [Nitrospinota bacterium]|nr:ribonuclease D [Nitrospinota bacterium]MED5354067.1 ribonuclease D [Nitrospinota bacterium]